MLGAGVAACEKATNDDQNVATDEISQQQPASPVIVTVGDEVITQDDLNATVVRTLGEFASMQIDDEGRRKVLESMVMSKSMAIAQRQTMSEEQLVEIEREVSAFRDELLTKAYLKDNVSAAPVSEQMVKDYYQKYPERFGGKTVRHYEIVKVKVKQQSQLRNELVETLSSFETKTDWKQSVKRLKQNGQQFEYGKGAADGQMLEQKFAQVVNGLNANQVSPVYFFDGYPSIIRVNKLVKTPPKPLSEVAKDIRKTLLPVQLKQAIKQAASDLSTTVKVEYKVPNE